MIQSLVLLDGLQSADEETHPSRDNVVLVAEHGVECLHVLYLDYLPLHIALGPHEMVAVEGVAPVRLV